MDLTLTLDDITRNTEREEQVKKNSFLTKDVPDPDAAAENRKMATSLGMDPFFVDRNHEQVREMYTTQGLLDALSGAPGVTRYLRDVNNFAISKDDVPALTGLEKLLKEGSPSHATPVPPAGRVNDSGVQQLYDPTDTPEMRAGVVDTKALKMFYYNLRATIPRIASGMLSGAQAKLYELTQPKPEGEVALPSTAPGIFFDPKAEAMAAEDAGVNKMANANFLLKQREIAQANPDMAPEEIQRLASIESVKGSISYWQSLQYDPDLMIPKEFETPETWFQSLAASAGGTAGGMTAFIVNPMLGLGLMNVEMAGRKSEQYLEEGIDPITANRAAYLYSILSTPVEFAGDKLQIGRLAKILKGGTLTQFAKNAGVAGLGEGSEEWLQIAPEAIADTYAQHPDWTWGQIVTVGAEEAKRRMFSSEGAQTALMGAAVGTLFAGAAGAIALPAQLQADQRRADWVEKDKETLAAMDKTVEDLKTKLRMEGKTEEAIEAILEENPDVETHVYFPADRLTQLFQDDVKEARRAFEAMGVTPEEVAEKAELGADVAVPVGTYVAKVAGTDLAAKLAGDRRLAKDGMTPNRFKVWLKEVDEETQEVIDQLKSEVKVYTEGGKQIKAVFTDFRDNLAAAEQAVGTGLDTASNNAYAFAAVVSTIAKRNNQTPMQVYEQFKPEIVAGIYAGAQAQGEGVLNQPAFHGTLHKFTRFMMAKIGAGEGSQYRGYGLYFAELRDVAEYYRALVVGKKGAPKDEKGQLYEVDVPEIEDLLAFHKTLEDQSEQVKAAVDADPVMKKAWAPGFTGQDFYYALAKQFIEPTDIEWTKDFEIVPGDEFLRRFKATRPKENEKNYSFSFKPDTFYILDKNWEKSNGTVGWQGKDYIGKDGRAHYQYEFKNPTEAEMAARDLSQKMARQEARRKAPHKAGEKLASAHLSSKGIKGNYFLDKFSRKGVSEKESRIFVVYDEDAIKITKTYYQDPKSPRASFQFSTKTGKPLITLFQTANESSFLHETGHLYLEMIRHFAHQGTASKDFMADWRIIQKEFGLDDSNAPIPEEAHEKFAEGLVNYFAEGKAPNSSLRGVFHRFAKWLSALAKELSGTYQPSAELKGVFDRLYASERDIAAAESVRGKKDSLLDALKMTDKEAEAYKKLQAKATMTSEEKRLAALLKARAAARLKLAGGRKGLAAQIEEDLLQEPAYAAIEDVRANGLNRTAAKEFLDQKEINALGKRLGKGLKEDTEVTPDALALKHGYASPEDLLRDMLAAPAKAQVIQERLDTRVKEIENEAANGQNEQGETLAGERDYHSPERLSLLLVEVQMLEDKLNTLRKTPRKITDSAAQRQALAELAEEKLNEAKVSDAISYRAHSRAELKARKLSEKAMKKGDFAEAARQKMREAINHAYVLEAVKLREWHSRAVTALKRSANQQSLTDEARNLIGGIVHRFGVVRTTKQSVAESTAAYRQGKDIPGADKWAAQAENEGYSVAVPDIISGGSVEDYRGLAVSTFRDITEFVKSIKKVDKDRREMLYQGKRMKLKAVVAKLRSTIGDFDAWKVRDRDKEGTVKAGLQTLDAFMMRIEMLCKRLDNWQDGGPWWTAIFLPMSEAYKTKMALLGPDSDAITKLFHGYSIPERVSMNHKNIVVPGLEKRVSKWDCLMVLLHSGTESSYFRVLDGENWTEEQHQAVIDTLSEKDVRFAEAIWALNESHWNDVKALQERTGNAVPTKLPPREVQTRFGPLKGGYFPAKADSKLSAATAKVDDVALAQGLLKSTNPTHAQTKQGHTKERAAGAGGRRLSFDPITIVQHLNEVTHDLGYREAIMGMVKLLRYSEYVPTERGGSRQVFPVQEMIRGTLGQPYLNEFTRWVNDVADNGSSGPKSPIANMGRMARLGVIAVKMGLKMTTAILQPLGITQSMNLVNVGGVSRQFFTLSGLRHAGALVEQFPFLKNRMYSYDRNIYDFIHTATVKGATRSFVDKMSMYLVSASQFYLVDCPTFEAAYAKHLSETGDEKLAEQLAESDVRLSQGSGLIQDMSRLLRGGEAQKLVTTFSTFFNVFYNLSYRNLSKTKSFKDVPALIGAAFLTWFIPSVLAPYMTGRAKDWDDDDWDKWIVLQVIDYPMQTLPLVGELGSYIMPRLLDLPDEQFDFQVTPAMATVKAATDWIDLFGGYVNNERDLEELIEPTIDVFGYGFRLPTDQAKITVGNIAEFLSGEDSEFYIRDLIFKKPKERR